ncbi:hypothetical protein TRVL_04694 [Trypanosoma vivax]|nr:hypothetical protein TRVL_04694 [Trypanosoma vivax]
MGQRGFVSTICRSTENGVHMPPADGAGARPVSVTLPAELPGIAPVPLGHADVEISKCSWLTVTESALAREWHAARVKQSKGVSSTSPHVPLTCASVVFPQNRSSGIIYSDPGRDLEKTGIPVGQEYFRALQSAWRNEASMPMMGRTKGSAHALFVRQWTLAAWMSRILKRQLRTLWGHCFSLLCHCRSWSPMCWCLSGSLVDFTMRQLCASVDIL